MRNRRLSAIMFTDLAGYTALMQEDETHAKQVRDRHREILEKEIDGNGGHILQYYGDGALSVFDSTVSAATAAVTIQKSSINEKIPLRIGIHTGDVVIEDDGVFGDGVNIASRIESFAVSGSVMISDKVFDDLKNHPSFNSSLMGEFELKNVKRPVEVYALTNEGLVIPHRTELKGKVKERIKSIAVLPFSNRSADPENEYFSDGITEELISALAKSEGLKVISRTSSFAFKGKNLDVRDIGKQLEVQSILEGSVRKAGNKVRINAQLSSTLDGYQLWAETYDRMLEDIFEVQDEISYRIAQQLKEKFSSQPSENKEVRETVNIDAYNNYLKGLYYYNRWTPSDSETAVECFKKAVELAPDYSPAYSGMALAYSLMSTTGFINPKEGYELLNSAAKRALELNPENEAAYLALAYRDFFYRWDFEGSLKKMRKAFDINPNSADVNLALSLNNLHHDYDESIKSIERAKEIDPLSQLITRTLADVYYFKGEYEIAIEYYDSLLQSDPEFKVALEFKAWALLMSGAYDEAISLFESINGKVNHAIQPFVQLGYAYALKGDKEKALHYLDELIDFSKKDAEHTYALDFATLYTGLEMMDEAFASLKECMEQKIGAMVFLNSSPIWNPIKSDPRFKELLKEIGIPTT